MTTKTSTPEDLKKLKEIEIDLNIRGLWKGFWKICYEAPTGAFKWTARKADKFSKGMMTGRAALVTMPMGLMIRNGATVAHDCADMDGDNDNGMYMRFLSGASGLAAAGAAAWFGGTALYSGIIAKFALTGLVTKGLTFTASAVAAAFVAIPAGTAGVLAASTAIAVAATTLSVIPAIANIPTAFSRTVARWKGNKIDEKALQAQLAENSISSRYDRNLLNTAKSAVRQLDDDGKKEILAQLKEQFETAATPVTVTTQTAPAAKAKPAAPAQK